MSASCVEPRMSATILLTTLATLAAPSWGVDQVRGAPNAAIGADSGRAWAPEAADGGAEHLTVTFDRATVVEQIRILESYNAGAIVRVAALLDENEEVTLWRGKRGRAEAGWFEVRPNTRVRTNTLKIYLDTSLVSGWNEIDAIELVGDGRRQWVATAKASSSYGKPPPPAQRHVLFELQGQYVELTLSDGEGAQGKITDVFADFVRLDDDGHIAFVKRDAIIKIEP